MAAMPATVTVTTTKFGAGAFAVLDDDLAGPSVMFAATLDHDFLGAGDRRGGNCDRGNRCDNKSKLHDILSRPVKVRTEHPTRANVPIGSRENSEQAFRLDGILAAARRR